MEKGFSVKITIINRFYPPDVSPTARLAASLAKHRVSKGDAVTVIGGQGYVVDDQKLPASLPSEIHTTDGKLGSLHIHHTWTPRLGKRTLFHRCLDYFAFYLLACFTILRLAKQDVIVCLTTPPLIVVAGLFHKLLHRKTRLILWNMDCYPEVAERSGTIRPQGIISRSLQSVNRFLALHLDHIVCLDKAMKTLLASREKGHATPTTIIPNWEKLSDYPAIAPVSLDKRKDLPFTVLYSGNMGYGHSFKTLLLAARELKRKGSSVRFVITGGGIRSEEIQQRIATEDLHNISFEGYVSHDQLRHIQTTSHCALITLRDNMLGCMSPSKLHASLAMGLPVLYVGPFGSSIDEAISNYGCGNSLRNGDVDGFIEAVENLAQLPNLQQRYSRSARHAFEDKYCDQKNLILFDTVIDSTVVTSHCPLIQRDAA